MWCTLELTAVGYNPLQSKWLAKKKTSNGIGELETWFRQKKMRRGFNSALTFRLKASDPVSQQPKDWNLISHSGSRL